MTSTWTLKENSTGELEVTVEGEAWKKAQKKARKKINQKCVAGDRTYEAYKSGRTIPHTDGCGRG